MSQTEILPQNKTLPPCTQPPGDCREFLKILPDSSSRAARPISDLHAGRIGEYLAAADMLLRGFECFKTEQGMPYDLVADVGGKLLRIQVKTTTKLRAVPQRKQHIPAYLFWINRKGKAGRSVYGPDEVDIFALVCLDERAVGYIPAKDMPKTLVVRAECFRGQYFDEVVSDRNKMILEFLAAGESIASACSKFNLDRAYIHRIKNGKGYLSSAGIYLEELTFEKALRGVADA